MQNEGPMVSDLSAYFQILIRFLPLQSSQYAHFPAADVGNWEKSVNEFR